MSISAKDVKALRDATGAGMMDCKRSLVDADGDIERAKELLRERGLSKAGKRAGRDTSEGTISLNGDMPRYLMNGVYVLDLVRDRPFSSLDTLIEYTELYYGRYPALSLGHGSAHG